jgi:SAM-dependent methyltransferase
MAGSSPVVARVPRPLRAVGRRVRALRGGAAAPPTPPAASPGYDSWLESVAGGRLRELDAACAGGGPECLALFRDLDADLWGLLLTQEHSAYPNIRALLPDVPDPALQTLFNGTSGGALASQSVAFYRRLCERFAEHGDRALTEATVLDFGCGWGRLTRYFARDVEPGRLFGCDPVAQILDVCRQSRVPATLAESDFVPRRLPFDGPFDLAFAFSVFTHLSEGAHERCLRALHAVIRPGGLLVVTVRPPGYLRVSELMWPALEAAGGDEDAVAAEPRYLFVAHETEPFQAPDEGREVTYGEAVITVAYVRRRWEPMFELLATDVTLADPHQLVLTLRRRPAPAPN